MTDVVGVRAKRKRGRPRKDSNLYREGGLQPAENSAQGAAELGDCCKKDCSDDGGMVGSMVYGVVEGSFDAGFLISVRIGTNLTPFRGVVFQPRKVVAVTPANDVAPQARMYQRREVPVPAYDNNNVNQTAGFSQPDQPYNQPSMAAATTSNMEGKQFPYVHLRMVEEDEVMQAFEVSTSSNLPPINGGDIPDGKESTNQVEAQAPAQLESMAAPPTFAGESAQAMKSNDLYYNEGRSQEMSFFTGREGELVDSISNSPNLKLDLGFTVHKEKQMAGDSSIYGNIGYQQALVSGNPLLLPPEFIDEPLEFMMERPKTPPNAKTSEEALHRGAGDDGEAAAASSSYKLELATPHTRIADMDFVLSQPTQSNICPTHTNQ